MEANILFNDLAFGEGLRWNQGRFWYSDLYKREVLSFAPGGERRIEVALDDEPSGLGWLPDGSLLVVAMLGQKVMRRSSDGGLHLHAELAGFARGAANDMVVDHRGVAYVSSIGFDLDGYAEAHGFEGLFAEPGPPRAPVVMVSPDGKVEVAIDGLRFPNGMALVEGQLVIAQSLGSGLIAFDRDEQGRLGERVEWATFSRSDGLVAPDGISADSEGAIWLANAAGQEVLRVGRGGNVLDRVRTSQIAFSCTLGGVDGRDLLIATAPTSNATILKSDHSARLETARVTVPATGF